MLNNQKQLQLATFKVCWKCWTYCILKVVKCLCDPLRCIESFWVTFPCGCSCFFSFSGLSVCWGCCSVFLMLKRTQSLVELTLPPYFTFLLVCCVVLIPIGRTVKCWLLLTPQLSEAEANQLPFNISRLLLLHPFTTWFLAITNVTLTLSLVVEFSDAYWIIHILN